MTGDRMRPGRREREGTHEALLRQVEAERRRADAAEARERQALAEAEKMKAAAIKALDALRARG